MVLEVLLKKGADFRSPFVFDVNEDQSTFTFFSCGAAPAITGRDT